MTTSRKTDNSDLDLLILLSFYFEKKWIIIITSLVVFSISMITIFLKPTKYQANLLLQIQLKQPTSLGSFTKTNLSSEMNFSTEESVASQISLIRSKLILSPVIQNLGLDIEVYPSMMTHLRSIIDHNKTQTNISLLEVPLNEKNTKFYMNYKGNQQYYFYKSKDDLIMKGHVGTLTSNGEYSIQVSSINAANGSSFIVKKKHETDVMKKILSNLNITNLSNTTDATSNSAILNLSLIGENPSLITKILRDILLTAQQRNIERKIFYIDQALSFLNKQLLIAKESLHQAETSLNQYRYTNNKTDIKLRSHYLMSHISDINKQISDLDDKHVSLLQKYTKHYPLVIATSEKISELKRQRQISYDELKKMPASDQMVSTLNRDIQVKKELYLSILNQIHELQVVKSGIVSDIRVLLLPKNADIYMPINVGLISVMSLFVGLFLGIIIVTILRMKMLNTRICP